MTALQASRAAPARVLVVDDEPCVLVIMRDALNDTGKRALTAESADEALALMEESSVDLVVTDIRTAKSGAFGSSLEREPHRCACESAIRKRHLELYTDAGSIA